MRCLSAVRPDSFYERPIPRAASHRVYSGHVEAFDWNLIGRYALDRRPFHAAFDSCFAFGIDPPAGTVAVPTCRPTGRRSRSGPLQPPRAR